MNDKDRQTKADMQSLTESFLKGKQKEDPNVTEADKQAFREFMGQVTDHTLKNKKTK